MTFFDPVAAREAVSSTLRSGREIAAISNTLSPVLLYRRRLPHRIPDDLTIFSMRFSLAGALRHRWLQQPEIARIVVDALLHRAHTNKYAMHAFVVMPNHVHVVWEPSMPLSKLMLWLKARTGRLANRKLGRAGCFWQDESYDRVVRDSAELYHTIDYVHHNPVRAGLVARPEDWPWSTRFTRRIRPRQTQATKGDGPRHGRGLTSFVACLRGACGPRKLIKNYWRQAPVAQPIVF